jgi:F-type H+-transporting ATPase subunit epsilon
MAETVQFDLVSPERRLASVQATEVQIPGADGDMTAMAGHAPTITTLRPGLLRVVHGGSADDYVVFGGFAEIGAAGISVLAEQALPRAEVTQDVLDGMVTSAKAALTHAQGAAAKTGTGPVDAAAKAVADLVAVGVQLGIAARA